MAIEINQLPFNIHNIDFLEYSIANDMIASIEYYPDIDMGYVYMKGEFTSISRSESLTADDGVTIIAVYDIDANDNIIGIELWFPKAQYGAI